MDQSIINLILGCFGTLFGFLLHVLWTTVSELQKADKNLADKVAAIELLVAGTYVKREEFERFSSRMLEKLDSIDKKLTDHRIQSASSSLEVA